MKKIVSRKERQELSRFHPEKKQDEKKMSLRSTGEKRGFHHREKKNIEGKKWTSQTKSHLYNLDAGLHALPKSLH